MAPKPPMLGAYIPPSEGCGDRMLPLELCAAQDSQDSPRCSGMQRMSGHSCFRLRRETLPAAAIRCNARFGPRLVASERLNRVLPLIHVAQAGDLLGRPARQLRPELVTDDPPGQHHQRRANRRSRLPTCYPYPELVRRPGGVTSFARPVSQGGARPATSCSPGLPLVADALRTESSAPVPPGTRGKVQPNANPRHPRRAPCRK